MSCLSRMTELKCFEKLNENKGYKDRTLLTDKVLENLIKDETRYSFKCGNGVQTEVTPEMKSTVFGWMRDVCEEQECQEEVFLLAVNYMNRYLNHTNVKRNQLQLLGTASMFIASKLRESNPLNSRLLRNYTDNSIEIQELIQFEEVILSKLKWEIAVVTPLDFLKQLLQKIPTDEPLLEYHAKTIISYCMTEQHFWDCHPSVLAAAAFISAYKGIQWQNKSSFNIKMAFDRLCNLLGIDPESLSYWHRNIEDMLDRFTKASSSESEGDHVSRRNQKTPPPMVKVETATTPTDVHDVFLD